MEPIKILQLCKKFPYPSKDGESIAIKTLSHSLVELGCEMDLLSMNTSKHKFEGNTFPEGASHYSLIEFVEVDNNIYIKDAILNLFSGASFHISRFISEDFKKKLIELLSSKKYDFIQLETLVLAAYIPTIREHSKAKIMMRSHNVEFEIWERIKNNTTFPIKKWYLSLLVRRLKKFELSQINLYDLFLSITQKDLDYYKKLGLNIPSLNIPIGINKKNYFPDYSSFLKKNKINFIGSLDWQPNLEGLSWFLEHVWHKTIKEYPDMEFHIAGRNTPKSLLDLREKNIFVHGEVDDAKAFINECPIMIVPLRSGSGMRVKILEGMALGRVVITSSIGMEGIPAIHQKEILIADTPEEYVTAIRFCMEGKEQMEQIGKNAEIFIQENFDTLNISKRLKDKMQSMIHKIIRN